MMPFDTFNYSTVCKAVEISFSWTSYNSKIMLTLYMNASVIIYQCYII